MMVAAALHRLAGLLAETRRCEIQFLGRNKLAVELGRSIRADLLDVPTRSRD